MTRLGLGTIEGPMRHLPREILKHILSIDIAKRLKKINRWVNMWIEDLTIGDWMLDNDWMELFTKRVLDLKHIENRLRRIQE